MTITSSSIRRLEEKDDKEEEEEEESTAPFTIRLDDDCTLAIAKQHAMTLQEILRQTRWAEISAQDFYTEFQAHAVNGGRLDLLAYRECILNLCPHLDDGYSLDENPIWTELERIFGQFVTSETTTSSSSSSADATGFVSAIELAAGFSVFTAESKSDKLALGFHYFDQDLHLDQLNENQLWRYLRSILVMFLCLGRKKKEKVRFAQHQVTFAQFIQDKGPSVIMSDFPSPEEEEEEEDPGRSSFFSYSFQEFGAFYNSGGYTSLSWLELLDLKKWSFVWKEFTSSGAPDPRRRSSSTSASESDDVFNDFELKSQVVEDHPHLFPLDTFSSRCSSSGSSSGSSSVLLDDDHDHSTRDTSSYDISTSSRDKVVLEFELFPESGTERIIRSLELNLGHVAQYSTFQDSVQFQKIPLVELMTAFQDVILSGNSDHCSTEIRIMSVSKDQFDRILASMPALFPERISSFSSSSREEEEEEIRYYRTQQHQLMLLYQIYYAFNRSGSGHVNALELIAGLSVLCAGSKREKLFQLFQWFGGQGQEQTTTTTVVSRRQLWQCIRSILLCLLMLSNGKPYSAPQLAQVVDAAAIHVTKCVFRDYSHDSCAQVLTFEEFSAWVVQGGDKNGDNDDDDDGRLSSWIELVDVTKWPTMKHSIRAKFTSEDLVSSSAAALNDERTQEIIMAFEFPLCPYDTSLKLRIRHKDVQLLYQLRHAMGFHHDSNNTSYDTTCRDIQLKIERSITGGKKGKFIRQSELLTCVENACGRVHLSRLFRLYDLNFNRPDIATVHLVTGLCFLATTGTKSDKLKFIFGLISDSSSGSRRSPVDEETRITSYELYEMLRSLLIFLLSLFRTEENENDDTRDNGQAMAERTAAYVVSEMKDDDDDDDTNDHNLSIATESGVDKNVWSLSRFANWYNTIGFQRIPWLELLDQSKWPPEWTTPGSAVSSEFKSSLPFKPSSMLVIPPMLNVTDQVIECYIDLICESRLSCLDVCELTLVIQDAITSRNNSWPPKDTHREKSTSMMMMNWETFQHQCLPRLCRDDKPQIKTRVESLCHAIFHDLEVDGQVPGPELTSALMLFVRGSKSEKLSHAFDQFSSSDHAHHHHHSHDVSPAQLFRCLRSIWIGLQVILELPERGRTGSTMTRSGPVAAAQQHRRRKKQRRVADEVIHQVIDIIVKEMSRDSGHHWNHRTNSSSTRTRHEFKASSRSLSFEDFGEWYNHSRGFEIMSWIELLDVSKWPTFLKNKSVEQHHHHHHHTTANEKESPRSSMIEWIVAEEAAEIVLQVHHVQHLRQWLWDTKLHTFTVEELVQDYSQLTLVFNDNLTSKLSSCFSRQAFERTVKSLTSSCSSRPSREFSSESAQILWRIYEIIDVMIRRGMHDDEESQRRPSYCCTCLLMFTDGSLLHKLQSAVDLLWPAAAAAAKKKNQTTSSSATIVVVGHEMEQILTCFLLMLYVLVNEPSLGLVDMVQSAQVGAIETLRTYVGDSLRRDDDVLYEYHSGRMVDLVDFDLWFRSRGHQIVPWLSTAVLEYWPTELKLAEPRVSVVL